MRIVIIKDVPGYQIGHSYSVSDFLAVHFIKNGLGRAETEDEESAALNHIAKVEKMMAGTGLPIFDTEPETDPGVYPKGKDSKSQVKKRIGKKAKKGKK